MENKKIYLASPHMSSAGYEMEYVKEAFDTNWIAPLGENVNQFEKEIEKMTDVKGALALASGTAAIHLALKAVGVKKDDIVFCPTLTFSATANPIIYQNATPVFIDCDHKTWNIDPDALEKAFEKYPNVKAVLIVHLYGISADMDKIMEICNSHNVAVIEDAAESLGSLYKGRQTGTIGDYGIFSFNGNKIITTSGGGMLVSNNVEKLDKAKFWATQARDKARYYQHSELGFNYRMSNIVAGIGRGQLKVLEDRVQKKQYIFNYYKDRLEKYDGIKMMPLNEWDRSNCWLSCLTMDKTIHPIEIIEALEKNNIESRPIWKPMHMQPYFEKYDFVGNGVSEEIFKTGICLPSDTKMCDSDLERIVGIIEDVYKQKGLSVSA